MPTTFLAVAAAVVLLAGCGPYVTSNPGPTPTPGSPIRYATSFDSTEMIRARLVSLDADSMIFEQLMPGDHGGYVPGVLPTRQVARLQVKVGRRGNEGRGVLIGGAIGLALGVACTTDDSGFVPDEACLIGSTATGAVTGLLIGVLVHSDVWAPAPLPTRPPEDAPGPAVTLGALGLGVRIPFRLAAPAAPP